MKCYFVGLAILIVIFLFCTIVGYFFSKISDNFFDADTLFEYLGSGLIVSVLGGIVILIPYIFGCIVCGHKPFIQ